MPNLVRYILIPLVAFFISAQAVLAETGRYRIMWTDAPASTMTIGWDQISGSAGKVYFDVINHGANPAKYAFKKLPENVVVAKGMSNHFVKLTGLRQNTVYYFLIADSEGTSQVFSFKTAPNRNTERLSIIAGSDSRNHRKARISANKLVSKLRPHCVLFGGDFTDNDSDIEWQRWLDDWQATISEDGRMYPLIVARGNHEYSNESVINMFHLSSPTVTYALSLGGDLLRIYTLNSLIACGGTQANWLQQDLANHYDTHWKIAQYHHPIRPHAKSKTSKHDQMAAWAHLFHEYGLQLAVESDAHVIKSTYPIRPSNEAGSDEGFIRDDATGTVFIGEGCWGAPLRINDDDKTWTRASGSFNAFHWIFIDKDKMEIRFVKTDGVDYVASVSPDNPFELPRGINIWNPPTGDVITIPGDRMALLADNQAPNTYGFAARGKLTKPVKALKTGVDVLEFSADEVGNDVIIKWISKNEPRNMVYELQRSVPGGGAFETLTTFEAKCHDHSSYEFKDAASVKKIVGRKVHYRLRQIFPNGESAYFTPKEVVRAPRINSGPIHKIMPDESDRLLLRFASPYSGQVTIRLFRGKKEVRNWEFAHLSSGRHLRTVDAGGIGRGTYLLEIQAGANVIQRYKVLIN